MSKMLIDDGGVFEGAETLAPTMPAPMACGGAARRLTRAQDTGAETRRPESWSALPLAARQATLRSWPGASPCVAACLRAPWCSR